MIDTRKEISEILVRWSMPTRQVAVNELIELCKRLEEEAYKAGHISSSIEYENSKCPRCGSDSIMHVQNH